jgi:OOP family OmpA-OmpF porin
VAAVPEPAPAPVAETPKAEAKVVIREHIRFASGSAVVPSSSKARLNEVAGILKNDPRTLTIAGHTDNQGPPAINRALSRARADAVKAYLVSQGVAADKLKAVGLGQDHPIANNKTP